MVQLLSKLKNGSLLQRSFLEVFGQQIQMNKTLPPTLTGLVSNTTLPAPQTAGLAFLSLIAGGEEYWEIQECCPTRSPEVCGSSRELCRVKAQHGALCCLFTDCPKQSQLDFLPFCLQGSFLAEQDTQEYRIFYTWSKSTNPF